MGHKETKTETWLNQLEPVVQSVSHFIKDFHPTINLKKIRLIFLLLECQNINAPLGSL